MTKVPDKEYTRDLIDFLEAGTYARSLHHMCKVHKDKHSCKMEKRFEKEKIDTFNGFIKKYLKMN